MYLWSNRKHYALWAAYIREVTASPTLSNLENSCIIKFVTHTKGYILKSRMILLSQMKVIEISLTSNYCSTDIYE